MKKQLSKIGDGRICPVAVIVKERKVLMGLRHYTPDKWKTISVWTIPGGRCDPGETLEATLRREVEEETGINDLEIEGYIGEVSGAKSKDIVPIFICKSEQEAQLIEPEKFSAWRWFNLDECPSNFINPVALELIKNHFNNDEKI
jgi:8-oxo-dGTP diphosphatase